MSKKIISTLLALMLALGVCLAFAGCGEEEPEETACTTHVDNDGDGVCDTEGCNEAVTPSPAPDAGYFNENGELLLYKDGAPTYQIVLGDDVGTLATDVDDLLVALNKLSVSDAKRVTATDPAQDVEILIGTVSNRGGEYASISKYSLGERGYMVKQVGTKIIVLGGSSSTLETAIEYLKETVFGIRKTNPKFTDFAMAAAKNYEYIQNDYAVESVTVDGHALSEYTVTYTKSSTDAKQAATAFRDALYTKVGIYLQLSTKEVDDSALTVQFNALANSGAGNGYAIYVDDDGDLVFDCEFEYLLDKVASDYYKSAITESKSKNVALSKGTLATADIRNLYYEDNGAKGDGETNDFEAIKATHELANEHGHIVNARAESIFYIGKTGGESITVKTDTNWNGCKFIFDDSIITVCSCGRCDECVERNTPIFYFESDVKSVTVTSLFSQFNSENPLKGGWGESDNTTVIPGWNLEYTALVQISDNSRKVFIRKGANADAGDAPGEVILVHPDGTIDPSTPLSYDYSNISWAAAYYAEDVAITLDGGGASVQTVANAPGADEQNNYNAFARNLYVARSNVTIMNFDHTVTDEGVYRAPYAGILTVRNANHIRFENITLQNHVSKYQNNVIQGTYEIGGSYSNDLTYVNVDTINFFCDGNDGSGGAPGAVKYRGAMGTNYCRNFVFDECTLTSFDAHKGLGNLTITNSTFEHINLIGSGVASISDSTVYADGALSVFNLREDYGVTWRGDIVVDTVNMRYTDAFNAANINNVLMVVSTKTYYHDFDFDSELDPATGKYVSGAASTNYLPINVYIKDLTTTKYSYTYVSPSYIEETELGSPDPVYLYASAIVRSADKDYNKLISEGGAALCNRYIATSNIEVWVSDGVDACALVLPTDAIMFKNTKYYLNGVLQTGWNSYS